MVKGISRQVIVVNGPEKEMFEQAIFILKADAVGNEGVTDEALLREADRLLRTGRKPATRERRFGGILWALAGAMVTSLIWIIGNLL